MTRRVRTVVIVGRDAAAGLAALTLQRAFGRTGVTVRVVELPSLLTAADAYAAVPSLASLHALLGLNDAEVFAAASGVPVLGQRFANWSRGREPFIHGYDTMRPAIADIDFLQFWVKARSEGLRVEFQDFSLAASAARQGRSGFEPGAGAPEAPVAYGFHLDATAYVDLVRRRALEAGVEGRSASVSAVERAGDRIVSVRLNDGLSVEGDLFIDASGPEAVLASGVFESWRGWYGADRVLTASAEAMLPVPAFSQIAAFNAGWIGLYPLRDRTAVTAVYSSAALSDREALEILPTLIGRPLTGDATVETLEPGMRPAWTGNCVALGEAAVVLEPLDAVRLHLIHLGLSQLIALFPADAQAMPEAAAYNRGMASHVANVRDFQLAHYVLNQRFDDPVWDTARAMSPPETLAAKLRKFAARGVINLYDDESFQPQNWTSSFVGHGLIPRAWDPLIEAVPVEEQMAKTQGLLARIAEEVRAMPALADQLGRGE